MKLEDKIRDKLRDWVAEDELEAIIDTELNKARKGLQTQVAKSIHRETETLVKNWFEKWKTSDQAKEHTEGVITDLLEKVREGILKGEAPTDRYGNRNGESIYDKVLTGMQKTLSTEVDAYIQEWRTSKKADEFKKQISAELIPKAAGFALAQLAETVLSGKINQIMHPDLVPRQDTKNQFGQY